MNLRHLMSKYAPLKAYLKAQVTSEIPMTFAEIEKVLGAPLPATAFRARSWWANQPSGHAQAKAWLEAGYVTAKVDMEGRTLSFLQKAMPAVGTSSVKPASGFADAGQDFTDPRQFTTDCRHPAYGALEGTFWIDPAWDLAQPTLSEEEMDEWEASIARKAKMLEKVFTKLGK